MLVSAGGTREPIDAVRFVGNRSSGRMGVALAEEARRRGAEVTLLAANLAVPAPAGVDGRRDADRGGHGARGARARGRRRRDHGRSGRRLPPGRPRSRPSGPKDAEAWALELEPTTDVLRELGERRQNGQVLVGFAAEHGRRRARARGARSSSASGSTCSSTTTCRGTDIGFDSEENEVVILSGDGSREVPRAPKAAIAAAVLDEVERAAEWTR